MTVIGLRVITRWTPAWMYRQQQLKLEQKQCGGKNKYVDAHLEVYPREYVFRT